MTPNETIFVAVLVLALVGLVPTVNRGTVSLYDAGMFAMYLIVLAFGATKIVGDERACGWSLVIVAAIGFATKMYLLFIRRHLK